MELSTCLIGNVPPLELPIQDIKLASDAYVSAKGIGMSIHDQVFSFLPSFDANNSWVTLGGYCGNAQNYSCVATQHGIYNPPADVNKTDTLAKWNGSSTEDNPDIVYTFYNDDAEIEGHTLYGFPFYSYYYVKGGFTNPAALALGPDSSFIAASLGAGITPTKQWSIWPGNRYQNLDGLLVLGGYDKDRVAGSFHQYPVYSGRTYVKITGLDWEANNNSTSLMPNGTQSVWAILTPYNSQLSLTQESLTTFLTASGTDWNGEYGVYNSSIPPVGNLIVTLSDGSTTTIPSQDLYQFPAAYNDQGVRENTNNTIQRLMIALSDTDTLRFGLPFLTQKVFVSDFDRNSFYMADAVKSDFGTSAKNLQPLCTGGPTTTPTAGPTPTPTPTPSPEKHSNTAAIAGGVGGGLGGLLLIGLIAFFLIRRRKKRAQDADEDHSTPEISQPHHHNTPPPNYLNAYDTAPSSELGGSTQAPYSSRSATPGLGMQLGQGQKMYDQHDGAKDGMVTGVHAVPQRYELESDGPLAATSGPIDMPNDYDQRWHSK